MPTPVVALGILAAAGGLFFIGFRRIPLLMVMLAFALMGEWMRWWSGGDCAQGKEATVHKMLLSPNIAKGATWNSWLHSF